MINAGTAGEVARCVYGSGSPRRPFGDHRV